jgi:hypothetical protein
MTVSSRIFNSINDQVDSWDKLSNQRLARDRRLRPKNPSCKAGIGAKTLYFSGTTTTWTI